MSDYLAAMFRRRPNDGWFKAGRYDATTTDILCAAAVFTMFLYGLAGQNNFFRLALSTFLVREEYEVWRLVTWSVATRPAFFPLLGVVFFWVFGQQLEALFGRNRFLMWVVAVTIIPATLSTLLGALASDLDFGTADLGLHVLFLGGIWVYAGTYPGVKWFEVVPLWAVAAIFTLLDVLQFNGVGATGMVLFILIAVGVSLVAGRSLGLVTGWPVPHIDLTGVGGGSTSSKPAKRSKRSKRKGSKPSGSGARVVEGPWQNAPAPTAPPTGPSPADQAELDELLDKIGADGMDALSTAEKRRLNELSKRLRNR